MKKLFIDCSFLPGNTELNTGIQRVVRQISRHMEGMAASEGLAVVPVDISHGRFNPVAVQDLYLPGPGEAQQEGDVSGFSRAKAGVQRGFIFLKVYLKQVYIALLGLISAILYHPRARAFFMAPRNRRGFNMLVDKMLIRPVRAVTRRGRAVAADEKAALPVSEGDILLLLDSSWHMDIWQSVARARAAGAKVISVLYDLIPVTHPQYCDASLVPIFKTWLDSAIEHADGFIAISNTVEKDFLTYIGSEYGTDHGKKTGFFHLGSDFNPVSVDREKVRKRIRAAFSDCPTFLLVSTLEPRKNHAYLLDVFDRLWAENKAVNLCFVGRVGWKVDGLMDRINRHPRFGTQLFLLSGISDMELAYCYENAHMLLFPSFVEGFGLPIVESLAHGLPVLASDIPIHREVGRDRIGYFNLDDPAGLADKIMSTLEYGIPASLTVAPGFRWIDWKASTRLLLDNVLAMAGKEAAAGELLGEETVSEGTAVAAE